MLFLYLATRALMHNIYLHIWVPRDTENNVNAAYHFKINNIPNQLHEL